jgi:outer membrane usher protein
MKFLPNICGLLALLLLPPNVHGADRAIANVVLNHENKGDYFFILTGEDRLLFSPQDLLDMGIRVIPEGAESGGNGFIYLDSLFPAVGYEFDEKGSVLHLTAEPGLLGRTTIDLSRARKAPFFHSGDSSAFLNYALNYTAEGDFDFASLALPLEIGFSRRGYLGLSNFSYIKSADDERFVRLLTSFVKDDVAELNRFIIGDFPAHSGLLGSGGILGGVSLSTNYSIDPYLLRYPGLDIYGMARNPSEVEIYVNDSLVKKEHVSPGEFEFLNMTNVSGAGEAVLVIRDAFGQEERLTIPYYASTMLLSPGRHDYSYNLGFKREALGTKSFNYSDLAFLSFHRFGFSRVLTGGFRAELDHDVVNVGPMVTFLPGRLGEVDIALAGSTSHGKAGYGGSASYFRAGRHFSGRILAKGFSREYANIAITPSDDKVRLEAGVNLGFRQNLLGSFSLSYSVRNMHEGTDKKRTSIYYNRRLIRNVSFNAMAARTEGETRTDEVFAGLMILFGQSRSGHIGYRAQDGASITTATLQQNPPLGKGFGYRLGVDRKENGQDVTQGDAFLQYRGGRGIYSAGYRRSGEENIYHLNAAGGIAVIGGSLYPTRPINDGFALVKVGNFEDVEVMYNNQEIGRTDRRGEILIPGLVSYHQNDISINDKDIPVNYEIREIKKSVAVPYRGGERAQFELRKLQGFTGRLFIVEKGERMAAEYWGLEIRVDEAEEMIVGKKGFFYLENVPAGELRARLFKQEKECLLIMAIPESEETMVELGEVTCAMD